LLSLAIKQRWRNRLRQMRSSRSNSPAP